MNNLSLILAGVFACLSLSWGGVVLATQVQLSGLAPAASEDGGPLKPALAPGLAVIGKDVYVSQGCQACHTQQVRPAGQGADIARGWGKRPSVARDYILQDRVLLGDRRLGPDLADVGTRLADDAKLHLHLLAPDAAVAGSTKPGFAHLYQQVPAARARNAVSLPEGHALAPAPGMAWAPTDRAVALVAYLRSLRADHASPEAPLPE